MSSSRPARAAARRTRSTIAGGLAVLGAALIGTLSCQSLTPSSPSLASPSPAAPSAPPMPSPAPPVASFPAAPTTTSGPIARRPPETLPRGHRGALGEADGAVPDGVTVFDGEVPAVANLDPALLGALRQAASVAAGDGVTFSVTSGWRSPVYQEQLLREAVSKYGSEAEAARWVATPTTSAHVSGDAVDIGSAAAAWLSRHGVEYGLCQIYDNEPWHYELRPDAVAHGCPARYADPTHDPRMQP